VATCPMLVATHLLYDNRTSSERITMNTTVEVHTASDSMMILGWVTITAIAQGDTAVYGIFDTLEKAISHGDKLINANVVPIYAPSIH